MSQEQTEALKDGLNEIVKLSIDEFKKTIQLKSDFTPAYYLLAQVYEFQGEIDSALQGYQIVLKLEPRNKEVIEKIESLK